MYIQTCAQNPDVFISKHSGVQSCKATSPQSRSSRTKHWKRISWRTKDYVSKAATLPFQGILRLIRQQVDIMTVFEDFQSSRFVWKQTEHTCQSPILPIIDILCLLLLSVRYFSRFCTASICGWAFGVKVMFYFFFLPGLDRLTWP